MGELIKYELGQWERLKSLALEKGNPDPSRALAPGADGIAAAGRDDRAVLPDSVDVAGWRNVADGVGLAGGRRGYSSAGRDHNRNTEKRARSIRYPGKT